MVTPTFRHSPISTGAPYKIDFISKMEPFLGNGATVEPKAFIQEDYDHHKNPIPQTLSRQSPLANLIGDQPISQETFRALPPQQESTPNLGSHSTIKHDLILNDYKHYSDLTSNPKTADIVRNIMGEDYRIVDLQASECHELKKFIDTLSEKFTEEIRNIGQQQGDYTVHLFTSLKSHDAFIFKAMPNGAGYYTGHVFISLGMVFTLIKNIGKPIEEMDKNDVQEILHYLMGLNAHEFVHPKEDELVKWEIRKSQKKSISNHLQIDELAADFLGAYLLTAANLPTDALLKLIRAIHNFKQGSTNKFIETAASVISSHPEARLRELLMRGALIFIRQQRGKQKVEDIDFDFKKMKADLIKLSQHPDTPPTLCEKTIEEAKEKGQEVLSYFLEKMTTEICKGNYSYYYENYLKWMDALNALLQKKDNWTSEEIELLTENYKTLYKKMLLKKNYFRIPRGKKFPDIAKDLKQHKLFKLIDTIALVEEFWFNESHDIWTLFITKEYAWSSLNLFFPENIAKHFMQNAIKRIEKECDLETKVVHFFDILKEVHRQENLNEMHFLLLKRLTQMTENHMDSPSFKKNICERLTRTLPVFNFNKILRGYNTNQDIQTKALSEWHYFISMIVERPDCFIYTIQKPYVADTAKISLGLLESVLQIYFFKSNPHDIWPPKVGTIRSTILKKYLANMFSQKIVKDAISEMVSEYGKRSFNSTLPGSLNAIINYFSNQLFPLTNKDKIELLKLLFSDLEKDHKTKNGIRGIILICSKIIQVIKDNKNNKKIKNHTFSKEISLYLHHHIFSHFKPQNSEDDYFSGIENFINPEYSLFETIQNHSFFSIIGDLASLKILNRKDLQKIYQRHVFENKWIGELFTSNRNYMHRELYRFWKSYCENESFNKTLELLRNVSKIHQSEKYIDINIHTEETFVYFLIRLTQGLVRDFSHFLDIGRQPLNSKEAQLAFLKSYRDKTKGKQLREFFILLFNPDETPHLRKFRKIINFEHLDRLAKEFIHCIPATKLSFEENLDLWQILTGRSANFYTDEYFAKYIHPHLDKLPQDKKRTYFQEILAHSRIKSEKIKVMLFREVLKPKLQALKTKNSSITTKDFFNLLKYIEDHLTVKSHYRDELLEDAAFLLHPKKDDVKLGIEPAKSFNYKSIDQSSLNLLSGLSIVIARLKKKEKLALLDYFQKPENSIREVLPWLSNAIEDTQGLLKNLGYDNIHSFLEYLDTFVRDANENQRLILIEIIIGSQEVGLWYQGPEMREAIYQRAGMTIGSMKYKTFQAYLSGVPEYEQTFSLSHMLSYRYSDPEFFADEAIQRGRELRKTFEIFDTPGQKGAQITSILGVFGQKESKELAKTKNSTKPLSYLDILNLLDEHLPPEIRKQMIGGPKLLGSASVKCVVMITLKTGKKLAVSLRRPYLDEKNEWFFDMADKAVVSLKEDPDFDKFDFDYLIQGTKEQLELEVQFPREAANAKVIAKYYQKQPSHKGWKFRALTPIYHSEQILVYPAIDNAIPFDELSEEDRKIASELIVKTELKLLFNQTFDADRHMGNYLFVPETKEIIFIDPGQVYQLQKNRLLKPGDTYSLAKILYAFNLENKSRAAEILTDQFLYLATEDSDVNRQILQKHIQDELEKPKEDSNLMFFRLMRIISENKVRLPLRITMGIIKGLTILSQEGYTKEVGMDYFQSLLTKYVKKELIKGWRFNHLKY